MSWGTLLAVDIGLKTGLALYGRDGRLCWYRSKNFGTRARLKRRVHTLLGEIPELAWLILEGNGNLAEIWKREAERRGIATHQISAEVWRQQLLYPRQRRSGPQAKECADGLARQVIEWSGAALPTSLSDDAAEAILIGLWAVLDLGWLERLPDSIKR